MFKDLVEPVRSTRARAVADFFADSDRHKSHSRPIDRAEADSAGVVIDNLEDSQELQDAVLSVHYATLITLQSTPSVKIIENDLGRSFVVKQQVAQMQIPMVLPQGMPLPAAQPVVAPAGSPT